MSKFKPGDKVQFRGEPTKVRTVVGPCVFHPETMAVLHFPDGHYATGFWDDYELAPDPREEAIEKAVAAMRKINPYSEYPRQYASALADAGLLKY